MATSAAEYKKLKEDFVSGLTGGPVGEINLVTAVVPVAILLWSVLQKQHSFFTPYTPSAFVVDYLLSVGAALLSTTLYASQPVLLIILLLVPAAALYLLPPETSPARKKPAVPRKAKSHDASKQGVLSVKPFLTSYRGSMMMMTCVAILAVDFPLFPRRFAKVETWGTSLMDLGVGSFVFSAGLVAARPVITQRAEGKVPPLPRRLLLSLRHSLPLLALGVVRTLSVKGLDYAEHVTEYGVHWNFFFTLGLLPPFVAALQSALGAARSFAVLALLLAVGYEAVLDKTNLGAYVLTAPRVDLLSMNKEGVFSFFGYLAIFLAGQDAGMYVLPRSIHAGASRAAQRRTLLLTLGARAVAWAALYLLATGYGYGLGLQVSRRLANLPYVLWVAAFNSAQLLVFCVIDSVFFPDATGAADEAAAHRASTSRILRSLNRNGLAVFLLANLLTGLVNMTVPTLDASPAQAMGILVGYSFVLCAVAVELDEWDVTIKL